jgi:hypothetical protein
MSVKFKEESFKETISENVTGKGHDLAHEVGAALTKGGGPNGYLAVCPNVQYARIDRIG